MDHPAQHIAYLWRQYIAGTASAEELETLLEYNRTSGNDDAQNAIIEQILSEYPTGKVPDSGMAELMLQSILKPGGTGEAPVRSIPLFRRWWAAAVLLLLLAGAGWWVVHNKNTPPAVAVTNAGKIQPGMDGAILTLSDGSQVLLDTIHNATVAIQSNVIVKVHDGTLIYEGVGDAVVYNMMSTPKGRQYRLTLPDGTNVWLNAASSIRYPTVFSGTERRVEMTGEAYFEVATLRLSSGQKMPFIVQKGDMSVQVLGTHFNINAYENENIIKTTLLEGSVQIGRRQTADGRNESVILKPGEQAIVKPDSPLTIHHSPNLEQVVAWKNGLFDFNGASLAEVMRQLERWYDIKVIYEQQVPEIFFGGKVSRKVSLDGLLKGLEDSRVHFRIEEGRRLVVLP